MSSSLLSPREPALADEVAARVLALLDARREVPTRLVDAAALAQLLGVSRSTVYEHALELGVVQIGGGDRPRLRFDPQMAIEAWTRRSGSSESQATELTVRTDDRTRRRRPRLGSGADLLPVKGQRVA